MAIMRSYKDTEGNWVEVEEDDIDAEVAQQVDKMQLAAELGDLTTVQLILADLRKVDRGDQFLTCDGGGPLYPAATNGHNHIVEYLCSEGAATNVMLVEEATVNRHTAVLETLLNYGWNINYQLGWDDPPALRLAVDDLELTKWFLSHGADPNARCTEIDITPLSNAVGYGSFEVIKLLFEHGGSVNHGQIFHHAAARTKQDRIEVLEYLSNKGVDMNKVQYENDYDSYLNQMWRGVGTPVDGAARVGCLDSVQWLIEHGANPLIRNSYAHTAIETAERCEHYTVAEYLASVAAAFSEPIEQFAVGRRLSGTPGEMIAPGPESAE